MSTVPKQTGYGLKALTTTRLMFTQSATLCRVANRGILGASIVSIVLLLLVDTSKLRFLTTTQNLFGETTSDNVVANTEKLTCSLTRLADLPQNYSVLYEYRYLPKVAEVKGTRTSYCDTREVAAMSARFQALLETFAVIDFNESTATGTIAAIRMNAPFGELVKMYIVDSFRAFKIERRLSPPADEYLFNFSWLQIYPTYRSMGKWESVFSTPEPSRARPLRMVDLGANGKRDFSVDMWISAHLAHRTLGLSIPMKLEADKLMKKVKWPNRNVIGLHVRRGDACECTSDEMMCRLKPQGGDRCCPTLHRYIDGLRKLSKELNTRYVPSV